jgi:hypothetical protein
MPASQLHLGITLPTSITSSAQYLFHSHVTCRRRRRRMNRRTHELWFQPSRPECCNHCDTKSTSSHTGRFCIRLKNAAAACATEVARESRQGDSADYDDEGHSEDLRQTDIQCVMVAIKKRDVWGIFIL